MAGKEDDNMGRRESGNTIDEASIDGLCGSETVTKNIRAQFRLYFQGRD